MADSSPHSELVATIRAGIAPHPDEPTDVWVTLERNALTALDSLEEQVEILDKQRLKWERLAMDRGFANEQLGEQADLQGEKARRLEEQFDTLRDVLAEADDQLALENEKHPNHNISLVRQRIASVVSSPAKERQ